MGFKNWHCFLPEGGTHVPKHVRDARLTFLLRNVAFSWYNKRCKLIKKMCRMGNLKICNILLTTDNTFTVHVRNLIIIEFLLFVKSQFTTNTQNIRHLNSRTDACDHGISHTVKRSGYDCDWFYRHQNLVY